MRVNEDLKGYFTGRFQPSGVTFDFETQWRTLPLELAARSSLVGPGIFISSLETSPGWLAK